MTSAQWHTCTYYGVRGEALAHNQLAHTACAPFRSCHACTTTRTDSRHGLIAIALGIRYPQSRHSRQPTDDQTLDHGLLLRFPALASLHAMAQVAGAHQLRSVQRLLWSVISEHLNPAERDEVSNSKAV